MNEMGMKSGAANGSYNSTNPQISKSETKEDGKI